MSGIPLFRNPSNSADRIDAFQMWEPQSKSDTLNNNDSVSFHSTESTGQDLETPEGRRDHNIVTVRNRGKKNGKGTKSHESSFA